MKFSERMAMKRKLNTKLKAKGRKVKLHGRSSSTSRPKSRRKQRAEANAMFALILAAIFRIKFHKPLIAKCLSQLRLTFLSKHRNPNPNIHTFLVPILALLPALLNSRCDEIVSSCARFIGSAAISSFEMNEQIASDSAIVNNLIALLRNRKPSVSLIACNAILDLSTTSIGRDRLLEASALEKLISCYLQVPISSKAQFYLFTDDNGSKTSLRIGFKENELQVSLIDATVTLINSSIIEQLQKIPRTLSETYLAHLKKLWAKVRKGMLFGATLTLGLERHIYVTNIRTYNLAESIFRLSIIAAKTPPFCFKAFKKSFFGCKKSSFEDFISNHWEISPFLLRSPSKAALTKENDILSTLVQSLKVKEPVSYISSTLQNFISCTPCDSDELDILNFLKEVKNNLGFPVIYQQDLRVLKTEHSKREVHLFEEKSSSGCTEARYLKINDILRCGQAYKEGYTVALRGAEFRLVGFSAITSGLAFLFGQPSAGANLYLTPPNAQGLARHFDDHCVLVCQLIGAKKWTISTRSDSQLPRLYDTECAPNLEVNSSTNEGCRQFLLREGDVLYIPRGFPHEASTVMDDNANDETGGFSLHLTLAIEVEPPFEIEILLKIGKRK